MDHQLKVFVTVAEKKNFSRAAEVLNLTQPAISQHIHALEEYYRARLFDRSNKKVELTQAGAILYAYAQKILTLHQEAERAVTDLIELVTGKIVVGASMTIGEYVLPRLLGAYARKYPEVELAMTIGNTAIVFEQTLEGTIDIGLVEGPVEHAHLQVEPFLTDEMVLIVPPDHFLASKPVATAEDLSRCTIILREEGSGTRLAAENALRQLNTRPARILQLGSTQAIKEAVEAGLGISFLSRWAIRKELALGTVKPVRLKDTTITREFKIIRNQTRFQSRASDEFINFITRDKVIASLRNGF
ncbi:LysR family transcriptional regulator [Desulfofundulus thermobenzoicus]|uniref:LysR family transcriptional regulator n=1 Tax=Desulfofundulus thermobenzoicus TaxID=29376 RepID=A0A6N7IUN3_9FIRM|nr:selenium metabolism-associated LysR family transcriptional regulator [Desulfofundulus thermobenzoicus]MQL53826.1 LysR family transcriptional regulator [Desulfofundulus thermobenzoicus]HHW43907.1 LysR family transcriptional regulator [Desulfotomaculum sp.]